MRYEFVTADEVLYVKLRGDVDIKSWGDCFVEAALLYRQMSAKALLIDGTELQAFHLSHSQCREMAPGFARFADQVVFVSGSRLIYGMMRVVHGYAHNDAFSVCKTREEARQFLGADCVIQG